MFEAELLGLTESQYGHIAGLLLGPALGFAFLFLLSLPLKKLPFLAVDADFKPPEWVVPVFAITLVFLFFFFLVTTASLSSFKSHPDKEGFLTTFIKERKLNIERREGRLYRAEVTIAHYDQYSNLEIVVNGHRVFGSFSDCLMSYQCRPQGDQSAIDKLNTLVSLKLTDQSITFSV